jgi:hypothetical protein
MPCNLHGIEFRKTKEKRRLDKKKEKRQEMKFLAKILEPSLLLTVVLADFKENHTLLWFS